MTCRPALRFAFLAATLMNGTPAQCSGPVLTPEQIRTAIQEGGEYNTVDEYLAKGLKGRRVKLAGKMAKDGIHKIAIFYNDWYAVAIESVAAKQSGRELRIADVDSRGLLHAFVEVQAKGILPIGKMDRRYGRQRANLLLKIGDRILQPTPNSKLKRSLETHDSIWTGRSVRASLEFGFDVSPEDIQSPVEVILIDGDGHKHRQEADLTNVLTLQPGRTP
jgi:hypothetical protein